MEARQNLTYDGGYQDWRRSTLGSEQSGPPSNSLTDVMESVVPTTWGEIGRVGRYFRHHPTLDPRTREIAILQVTISTRCVYAYAHHVRILERELAVMEVTLRALIDHAIGGASRVSEDDASVMHAARRISEEAGLDIAELDDLGRALGRVQASELVTAVAFYNCLARIANAFDVPLEPEYSSTVDRFPTPW